MPKWAVLQRLSVILWGLIKGDGQSGGTQGSGLKNTGEFNLNMFHHHVILLRVLFADEILSASQVSWFHNNARGELLSPLALYAAPWNPPFQALICVLGPVFPWKKCCDSDSPIGPQSFQFCRNLHPFFTFLPSLMCDLLLLSESFARLFPPTTSVAAFPTEPMSEQMSCHFCSLVTTSPASLGCYGSLPAFYLFLQWQQTLVIKLTQDFPGSLSSID